MWLSKSKKYLLALVVLNPVLCLATSSQFQSADFGNMELSDVVEAELDEPVTYEEDVLYGSCSIPNDTLILDSVCSQQGELNYTASKRVRMITGFSYRADSVGRVSLSAYTNQKPVDFTTDRAYLSNLGDVDSSAGYAVGEIPCRLDVSPTGATVYTVDLDIPEGPNGFKPDLKLVYNSQSCQGLAGWQWDLSGLSVIHRTGYVNTQSGKISQVRGMQYSSFDFAMDGMELCPKTSNTWRTLLDNHSIIFKKDDGFRVYYDNGSVADYGMNAESRCIPTGAGTPYSYYVNSLKDALGNKIEYTYGYASSNIRGNAVSEIPVVEKISYSSIEIKFFYEFNPYVKVTYASGYPMRNKLLLKQISIYSNGEHVNTYTLEYLYDKKRELSLLSTITKLFDPITHSNSSSSRGSSVASYPPIRVEWKLPKDYLHNDRVSCPLVDSNVGLSRRNFNAFDMDGDGQVELIELFRAGDYDFLQVYRLVNNSHDSSYDWAPDSPITRIGEHSEIADIVQVQNTPFGLDAFGDGKKHIVVPRYCELNSDDKTIHTYQLLWYDLSSNYTVRGYLNHSSELPCFAVADFNADGKDEVVVLEKSAEEGSVRDVNYFGTYGSSFVQTKSLGVTLPCKPEASYVADWDKDGLIDILVCGDGQWFLLRNNGSQKGSDDILETQFSVVSVSGPTLCGKSFRVGDFDGNGMPDILCLSGAYRIPTKEVAFWSVGLNCGYSDGTLIFDTLQIENMPVVDLDKQNQNDCLVWDWNNDGKSDLLVVGKFLSSMLSKVMWYQWAGNGFELKNTYESSSINYNSQRILTDFNGDGVVDLFSIGKDLRGSEDAGLNTVRLYSFDNSTGSTPLVSSFTSGFGHSVKIGYGVLTAYNSNYSQSQSRLPVPLAKRYLPICCVTSLISRKLPFNEDGNQTYRPLHKTYRYKDAVCHMAGRGFVGFGEIVVEDRNNIGLRCTERNTYTADGFLSEKNEIEYFGSDSVLTATEYDYPRCHVDIEPRTAKKNYRQLVARQYTTNSLTRLDSYTSFQNYDAYGNCGKSITQIGNLTTTEEYVYADASKGLPSTRTVTVKSGDDLLQRTESFVYSNGLLVENVKDPGTDKEQVVQYAYDAFGNQISAICKVQTPRGEETRSTSATFSQDGRFKLSETDANGNRTDYQWNQSKGRLTSRTDAYGRKTDYLYDKYNRLVKVVNPDGTESSTALRWNSGPSRYYCYYRVSQNSGQSPVTSYYDALGREVCVESKGWNNQTMRRFYQYDKQGRLWRKSAPTYDDKPTSWEKEFTYDVAGREVNCKYADGSNIATSYSDLLTTRTGPSGTVSTQMSAEGWIASHTVNGKSVSFTYYPDGKLKSAMPDGGGIVTMEYDLHGNRIKMDDPDAGIIRSQYDGWDQLVSVTRPYAHGDSVTECYQYDNRGFLLSASLLGEQVTYQYDSHNRLSEVKKGNAHQIHYTYDDMDRCLSKIEVIDGKDYHFDYQYDDLGRIKNKTFPSGYSVRNMYDSNGCLIKVSDKQNNCLYQTMDADVYGNTLVCQRGELRTEYDYDVRQRITGIHCAGVMEHSYSYDDVNLLSCYDALTNQTERYVYDNQNRLIQRGIKRGVLRVEKQQSVIYDESGSIIGVPEMHGYEMQYADNAHLHALSSVDGVPDILDRADLSLSYTPFGKVSSITEGNKSYTISYGVDQQRVKSVFTRGGATTTRYYLGDYEEVVDSLGNVTKYHYLCGGAVMREHNGVRELFLNHFDRLGSVVAVTTAQGEIIERYAYSPWGMRVNPDDWSALDERTSFWNNRGYTGHEHLDGFDLINMNGRMYDPLTCMFLSPDPQLQDPYNWLNYNRYAYCYGNPNMYTDPTGEFVWIPLAVGAAFGFISSMAATMDSNLSVGARIGYAFLGAAIGAGSAYVGGLAANSAMAVGVLPGALVGGATSAATSFAGSFVSYGVLNVMTGNNYFANGFWKNVGFSTLSGFVSGFISGGVDGYKRAKELEANRWTGEKWKNVREFSVPKKTPVFSGDDGYCYAGTASYADQGHGNSSVENFIYNGKFGRPDYAYYKVYGKEGIRIDIKENMTVYDWEQLGHFMQSGSELIGAVKQPGLPYGHAVNIVSITTGDKLKVFGGGWTHRVMNIEVMDPAQGVFRNWSVEQFTNVFRFKF